MSEQNVQRQGEWESDGKSKGERWYLLYTKPWKEDMVAQSLSRVSLDVYNSKLRRKQTKNGSLKERLTPLFHCYVFVKFDV